MVAAVRVLVVTDWYPEGPGDPAGSFVRSQALAMAREHDVAVLHLAAARGGLRRPRLDEEQDGPLRTLRLRRGSGIPLTVGNVVGTGAALRRLRRGGFDPDVLHAHEIGAGFAAARIGRAHGLPVIVSVHHSGFVLGDFRGLTARLARSAFARADVVCPVSASLREGLEAGGWPGRFRVVPNVVDTDRFTPGAPPADGPARIVVVASFDPVKGLEDLVEAAGVLARARTDFRIDLVGDGLLRARIAERIRELGLAERVTLRGTLPADDVAALMRCAAFAVVPSLFETFSVVLSEAMACGLPVVATAVGGMVERVHEGNGLLVAPREPERLAEAMSRMLDVHGRYDRAAIAAEVRERFSPAAVAAQWRGVYADVAAGVRPPRRAWRRSRRSRRPPARR